MDDRELLALVAEHEKQRETWRQRGRTAVIDAHEHSDTPEEIDLMTP
jgi:hypothetical protein